MSPVNPCCFYRLVGLVVKAHTPSAARLGSVPAFRRGSSSKVSPRIFFENFAADLFRKFRRGSFSKVSPRIFFESFTADLFRKFRRGSFSKVSPRIFFESFAADLFRKFRRGSFSKVSPRIFFESQVTPEIYKFELHWLPCQALGAIGLRLRPVGPVSEFCEWVRWQV